MTYDEAIEKMARALDEAVEIAMGTYDLSNPHEAARAAAEAIGLREMMDKNGAFDREHTHPTKEDLAELSGISDMMRGRPA